MESFAVVKLTRSSRSFQQDPSDGLLHVLGNTTTKQIVLDRTILLTDVSRHAFYPLRITVRKRVRHTDASDLDNSGLAFRDELLLCSHVIGVDGFCLDMQQQENKQDN